MRNILIILNADASMYHINNAFSQSSDSELYDIISFLIHGRWKKEKEDWLPLFGILFLHIHISTKLPETDFNQNSTN